MGFNPKHNMNKTSNDIIAQVETGGNATNIISTNCLGLNPRQKYEYH